MQLSTEEFICRTLRTSYIAECYVLERKWPEAVSLIDHAEVLAATAREKYQNLCLSMETADTDRKESAVSTADMQDIAYSIQRLDKIINGTRARLTALYTILAIAIDKTPQVSEVEYLDSEKHWSILTRPMQWVEPVANNVANNRRHLIFYANKQSLIVDENPAGFNPIPCKPVFFDIASKYIAFHLGGIRKKEFAR